MNIVLGSHGISLFCLCLFAISCKAQIDVGASDAKASGFNGPVKKVVFRCFSLLQNNDAEPSNKEPLDYNQHTSLLITSVSIYNKQGMATQVESENCTKPSGPPVRDYQIIKNGLGKIYDDNNRQIGHTTQSWYLKRKTKNEVNIHIRSHSIV